MFVHVALSGTFDSFLYSSDALGEVNWYNTYIETPPSPPKMTMINPLLWSHEGLIW